MRAQLEDAIRGKEGAAAAARAVSETYNCSVDAMRELATEGGHDADSAVNAVGKGVGLASLLLLCARAFAPRSRA